MKNCIITFRSVTPAQRAEEELQRMGVECTIQRTPKWMEERGCGYCLRIWTGDVRRPVELLRRNKVPFRKIYAQRDEGVFEEWQV